MTDRTIVNYHDSILKTSDVSFLRDSNWLNDRLIGFWFEYLDHDIIRDSSVAFISPEVTQLIKLSSHEDAQSIVEALELKRKRCVIMAINDSSTSSFENHDMGSHWSLLTYSQAEDKFFHLDSLTSNNLIQACQIALKLKISQSIPVELPCLHQSNSWDCGIFVCCHAELVANNLLYYNKVGNLPMMLQDFARVQRKRMQDVITSLSLK